MILEPLPLIAFAEVRKKLKDLSETQSFPAFCVSDKLRESEYVDIGDKLVGEVVHFRGWRILRR